MRKMLRHIEKRLSVLRPLSLLRPLGPLGLLGLSILGIMGLWGCSEEEDNRQHVTFEVESLTRTFDEKQPVAGAAGLAGAAEATGATGATGNAETGWHFTRTWDPPTGYTTYEGAIANLFPEQVNLFYKSIDVFFTQNDETPLQGTFSYKTTSNSWRIDTDLEATTYYLYGYIPKEVTESATISSSGTANDNSNYTNGAVLTLNGMKTVTHSDVCVIVGAKNGTSDDNDGGLTVGDFTVSAKATSSSGATGNHIFLLFDHLYSALRFNFRVDAGYAELRTIKLTKLELIAYQSNSSTKLKAKYNATITLESNPGSSPITNIVFTPDDSSADVAYEPIYSGAEVTLPSGKYPAGDPQAGQDMYTSFLGCFVPGRNTNFKIRTTYNVYDKQNNLIRKGCQAENAINMRSIFNMTATELERGHMYSLSITVEPTYLYVLSEPDLDNPTIKIE